MNSLKASDYIAEFLHAQGVPQVFEVVGGMITHLIDSIHAGGKVKLVSVHHEQGAAFAADAVGRITGIPGVAMATSGPGATNLLTGIGSCYFDSSPAIFITGQVNLAEQKGNRPIRQLGFQETDIVSVAKPITKAAWSIQSPEELPARLAEAFQLATSGRPGPVLLDIPMDVQRMKVAAPPPQRIVSVTDNLVAAAALDQLFDALAKAHRPLILIGGGIRSAGAGELFRQFANALPVPVVNSLMAVDVLPFSHPSRVGMIGSYGNRWANLAIGRADLLVVLGSRLDVRQTGAMTAAFKGDRTIFQVDCDAPEINNRVLGCVPIVSHLRPFLQNATAAATKRSWPGWAAWRKELDDLRQQWPDTNELRDVPGINPNVLMHQISRQAKRCAAYVVDVGQHQMWAAQSLDLEPQQRFLTSGGMGAMGFALPAAIGACFAATGQPVVMIAGDGGFQLNIQELQTIARHKLPVKMVVLNNGCHGMVRQFQESYFDKQYASTMWGYSAPDFAAVSRAYGIEAGTVSDPARVVQALEGMMASDAPYLLQVMIDTYANAYPKIAFGHPITEMEPFVKPLDMEGT
ncbi:MAG: thiamine pyrophosphate-binding protein [Verrucomicrobiota bacterium]